MRARNGLLVALGCGASCMFVFALTAIITFFAVSRRNVSAANTFPTWNDPTQVQNLKVDPSVSLTTLAGTSEPAAITSMVNHQDLDSALATVIFASSLTDRQRLGQILLIGRKYVSAGNASSAKQSFQMANDIAILSPSVSDYERAEVLGQIAASLYPLKEPGLAGLTLDSAREIVLESPFLKNANRDTLLRQLIRAAQQGDDGARIKQLTADRSNFVEVNDPSTPVPQEPPDPLPPLEAPAKNDALEAAQNKRAAAAQKILQLPDASSAIPDELIEQLGNQLFSEDDVRVRTYSAPAGQRTLAQKLALARAQIDWLTLKYKVARKAFGVSIMPEWEDAESEIRSQLAKAYENFYVLRTEQVVALPQTKDIELAQSYLLRRQLLAGRLGLYPNFPENDLVDRLQEVTDKLVVAQPKAALRVKVEVKGDRYYYHLVDDATWNVEPTARPKQKATATRRAEPATVQTRPAASPTVSSGTAVPIPPATLVPTPVQPTLPSTPTALPPTATNTAVPLTTNTSIPPTPTNTVVAPPPTPTATRPYP